MSNYKYTCYEPFGDKGDNRKHETSWNRLADYIAQQIREGKTVTVKAEKDE